MDGVLAPDELGREGGSWAGFGQTGCAEADRRVHEMRTVVKVPTDQAARCGLAFDRELAIAATSDCCSSGVFGLVPYVNLSLCFVLTFCSSS
jgi:hypothetical protein